MGEKGLPINQRTIITLAVILESVLAAIFFVWAWYRSFEWYLLPSAWELIRGVAYTIPLFALNLLVFGPWTKHMALFHRCHEFKEQIVTPLAQSLDRKGALVVAIFAGLGEELLFRGTLQHELGFLTASVLFAVLHFGPAVRRYFIVFILYLICGLYLGFIMKLHGSLWTVIITHGVYDYIALVFLKNHTQRSKSEPYDLRIDS